MSKIERKWSKHGDIIHNLYGIDNFYPNYLELYDQINTYFNKIYINVNTNQIIDSKNQGGSFIFFFFFTTKSPIETLNEIKDKQEKNDINECMFVIIFVKVVTNLNTDNKRFN